MENAATSKHFVQNQQITRFPCTNLHNMRIIYILLKMHQHVLYFLKHFEVWIKFSFFPFPVTFRCLAGGSSIIVHLGPRRWWAAIYIKHVHYITPPRTHNNPPLRFRIVGTNHTHWRSSLVALPISAFSLVPVPPITACTCTYVDLFIWCVYPCTKDLLYHYEVRFCQEFII